MNEEEIIEQSELSNSQDTSAETTGNPGVFGSESNVTSADAAAANPTTEVAETTADAGLLTDIWTSALNLIELGGPVVSILIVISIFGFATALYKFFQFSALSERIFSRLHGAIDIWSTGDSEAAKSSLNKVNWSLANTVEFGLEKRAEYDEERLREELGRQGNNFIAPYSKFLRPLELIYYLAPVLGLLGTVLGMIEAFKGLEASSGLDKDSTALAGGIWEALLTTAVGLSIAIPFTLIHAYLESKLDHISQMTSDLLTRVITLEVKGNRV